MKNEQRPTLGQVLRSSMFWHWAGVGVLSVLVLGLILRLGFLWTVSDASALHTLESKKSQLEGLAQDTVPLRGLDKRVASTRDRIQTFYDQRIPASYSLLATRIAELETKSGVRLSHLSYSQAPQPVAGVDLTEISMDASISGDYAQMMHFINGLERDQIFFVIRAMQLNGQQSGPANLRLKVSTWLRSADAAASGLPTTGTGEGATAPPSFETGREGN
jgi:type IV pilus assembly protein PilO